VRLCFATYLTLEIHQDPSDLDEFSIEKVPVYPVEQSSNLLAHPPTPSRRKKVTKGEYTLCTFLAIV
jgi:hypothetical protein